LYRIKKNIGHPKARDVWENSVYGEKCRQNRVYRGQVNNYLNFSLLAFSPKLNIPIFAALPAITGGKFLLSSVG
jgi:hypothetical protein